MFYILFTLAIAAAIAANGYDIHMTELGLAAKVGVEANDEFIGDHPTAKALWIRDLAFLAPFVAIPIVSHVFGNDPLAYGTLAGPVVACVRHILGGLAWKKLLKG